MRSGALSPKAKPNARNATPACSLARATLHKIPTLRSDDLLIDRLFEAIETGLHHAKLHLIPLFLPLHPLRGGLTGKPFPDRHGNRGR